jgi:hypothetical protein
MGASIHDAKEVASPRSSFLHNGVPLLMVMDGAKEQTMGEFRRTTREMGMRI